MKTSNTMKTNEEKENVENVKEETIVESEVKSKYPLNEQGFYIHPNGYTFKELPIKLSKDAPTVYMKLFNTITPGRLDDESYSEYKFRRRYIDKNLKKYLNGTPIWDSSTKGTLTQAKALEEYAKHLEQLNKQ